MGPLLLSTGGFVREQGGPLSLTTARCPDGGDGSEPLWWLHELFIFMKGQYLDTCICSEKPMC